MPPGVEVPMPTLVDPSFCRTTNEGEDVPSSPITKSGVWALVVPCIASMETRPYGVDDPNPESPPYGFKSRLPVPPRAMTWSPVAPANGPENVDVPAPLTVTRFAMSRDVVDAMGNVEISVVDVARKVAARTAPPNNASPDAAKEAPGVPVPMPTYVPPSLFRITKKGVDVL